MIEIDAEGIAMLECHEDPDVFRTRFGKAINFEYHEVCTLPNSSVKLLNANFVSSVRIRITGSFNVGILKKQVHFWI